MAHSFVRELYGAIQATAQVHNFCDGMPGFSLCLGPMTLGDILEILPFEDPVVVIEIDGEGIWSALESSLETWPAQEG